MKQPPKASFVILIVLGVAGLVSSEFVNRLNKRVVKDVELALNEVQVTSYQSDIRQNTQALILFFDGDANRGMRGLAGFLEASLFQAATSTLGEEIDPKPLTWEDVRRTRERYLKRWGLEDNEVIKDFIEKMIKRSAIKRLEAAGVPQEPQP